MVNKGNKSRTENISFDLWWRKSMYTHSLLLFVFVHTHNILKNSQTTKSRESYIYVKILDFDQIFIQTQSILKCIYRQNALFKLFQKVFDAFYMLHSKQKSMRFTM